MALGSTARSETHSHHYRRRTPGRKYDLQHQGRGKQRETERTERAREEARARERESARERAREDESLLRETKGLCCRVAPSGSGASLDTVGRPALAGNDGTRL
jgi:hypothetical protein